MPIIRRLAVVALAGLCPAWLAGCTRSTDGTLIMAKPPAVSSLLPSTNLFPGVVPNRRASPALAQYPAAPETESRQAKRRKPMPIRLDTGGNMKCVDKGKAGEGVKLVCT